MLCFFSIATQAIKSIVLCFTIYQIEFTLHSKANACNIDTFIRFHMQIWVEKNTKHLPIDCIGHLHNSVRISQSFLGSKDWSNF